MATANDNLRDATIRHQIGVRQFSGHQVRKTLKVLDEANKELVRALRERLPAFGGRPADFTTKRYRAFRRDLRSARRTLFNELYKENRDDLLEFSRVEVNFEERMFTAAIPVQVSFASVQLEKTRDIVIHQAFNGGTLREWFTSLSRADQRRLVQQIQMGLTQQEPVDTIVRRVSGTRANKFRDGVLNTTRNQTAGVVRTAVNHVSNASREAFWEENDDLLDGVIWASILDGRTTPICQANDTKWGEIDGKPLPDTIPQNKRLNPPTERPPAHVACRSVTIAGLSADGIERKMPNRPFVRDTRTRRFRERDFRQQAKAQGRSVKDVRRSWAQKNVGRQSADISYNDWLKDQPASFQDDVLGVSKGKLFRQGELTVDDFVDETGRTKTLDELARTEPEAFSAANLDPEEF